MHVVWKFIAVRVEEAAEEAFVAESGGEDFAGWEEILVGGVADGHVFCSLCLALCIPAVVLVRDFLLYRYICVCRALSPKSWSK